MAEVSTRHLASAISNRRAATTRGAGTHRNPTQDGTGELVTSPVLATARRINPTIANSTSNW
jgi:hypothetical protein